MADPVSSPETQLRRRRGLGAVGSTEGAVDSTEGAESVPTSLDIGYCVSDIGPPRGTPSPSPCGTTVRFLHDDTPPVASSSSLADFRKKQQSFEIQIEECEVEEMSGESGDEEEVADRPVTPAHPMPLQDFAVSVNYKEGPQVSDFLQVQQIDNDCLTDVSDAESDG